MLFLINGSTQFNQFKTVWTSDIKDRRPKVFSADSHSKDCKKIWTHWYRTFAGYV